MKIAVLSDCRMPTKATGGHGLGRLAWDLAEGLAQRGHRVHLGAGPGSEQPMGCSLSLDADESTRANNLADGATFAADVFIDLSHQHDLSKLNPALPVVNWVVDTECTWQPPRAVVGNAWQAQQFPNAKIVPLGIDVDAIPFTPHYGEYLAFAAKLHALKGVDVALEIHRAQSFPVRFVGERFDDIRLPDWQEELTGEAFYNFLGRARGLLSPSRVDAGGRVNLDAAACGTPVLCFDGTGTAAHVEHGVSGFLCRDLDEMVEAVGDLGRLQPRAMREWVRETHDLRVMLDGIERLAQAAAAGEGW